MAAPEFTRIRIRLAPGAWEIASMVLSAHTALCFERVFLACVHVVKTASPTSVSQSCMGMCCPSISYASMSAAACLEVTSAAHLFALVECPEALSIS